MAGWLQNKLTNNNMVRKGILKQKTCLSYCSRKFCSLSLIYLSILYQEGAEGQEL